VVPHVRPKHMWDEKSGAKNTHITWRVYLASFLSAHSGQGLISPVDWERRVKSLPCRHRFCLVSHGRR
jgi:hypothetical protein